MIERLAELVLLASGAALLGALAWALARSVLAGRVVSSGIPANVVAAGNPCRPIRRPARHPAEALGPA